LEHICEGHQSNSRNRRTQGISEFAEGSYEALERVASLQNYALVMLAYPSDDIASFKLVKPVLAVNSLVLGERFLVLLFWFIKRLQLVALYVLNFA
jgi:hypothetical protein